MGSFFRCESLGTARSRSRFFLWLSVWAVLALALVSTVARAAGDLPYQKSTPDDIPGELVVDFDDDMGEAEIDSLAKSMGLGFRPSSPLTASTRIHSVRVPVGEVTRWIARFKADSRVEVVEPLARVRASWAPNDPLLEQQWHLTRVEAKKAWAYATGRGVSVAVVDTGVACEDHGPYSRGSDLAQTWCQTGFNFITNKPHANDDHGHGTHVAGTIAQSTDNGLGAAGLAFHSRILPVKVLDRNGMGTTVAVADGIRFAADAGAHVINLSLGGGRASRVMKEAIDHARSMSVVVVAAAGNNGRVVEYPAAFDGVIAVSATDSSDRIAHFSSRGPAIDIAAPGVQVLQQTICNGGRDRCEQFSGFSGTSMAAPHVAAAAALLVSVGVTNPDEVETILKTQARKIDDGKGSAERYGAGLLDTGAAVSTTVWKQVAVRLALLVVLAALVLHRVRRKGRIQRPLRPSFLVAGLAFGPGLLFVLSLFAARVALPLDLLARPVPEWDMLIGASVHRWLPLANFVVPFALSAIAYGVKRLRPAVAGVALGTAAYLCSLPILGTTASSITSLLTLSLWALVNTLGCMWLAAINLDEREA